VTPPMPSPSSAPSAMARRLGAFGAALFGVVAIRVALPEPNLALPALVAWVPVLILARREMSWRQRLRLGWLLGFGVELLLFWFIGFTMREMTTLPAVAGVGLTVLYAAWHGLLAGVFLALAEPARRAAAARLRGAGPVAVAAVYAAVEWLWPQIFPWSLGHAFWQVSPVLSIAALTGVPGVAFWVMLINGILAEVVLRRAWRELLAPLGVAVGLLAFGVGWSAHVSATEPTGALRVAIVQPNFTLEEKQRASGRVARGERGERGMALKQRELLLDRLEARLAALPPDTFDLVVAPEGGFPLYWRVDVESYPPDGPAPYMVEATRRVQRAIAAGPRAHAIIGGLRRPVSGAVSAPEGAAPWGAVGGDYGGRVYPGPGADDRPRNTAVHFGPGGELRGFYDKQTLMPFGEYLPLSDVFPSLAGSVPGIANFAPGDRPCTFAVGDVLVGCGICYESVFAGPTRADLGSADALVNLTIDTWFGTTNAPESHLMLQVPRAVELGVPLIRAALTGISTVIGPDGRALGRLPLDVDAVLEVEVPLRRLRPPYRRWGPVVPWALVALAGLALGDAAWRRRRARRTDATAGDAGSPGHGGEP